MLSIFKSRRNRSNASKPRWNMLRFNFLSVCNEAPMSDGERSNPISLVTTKIEFFQCLWREREKNNQMTNECHELISYPIDFERIKKILNAFQIQSVSLHSQCSKALTNIENRTERVNWKSVLCCYTGLISSASANCFVLRRFLVTRHCTSRSLNAHLRYQMGIREQAESIVSVYDGEPVPSEHGMSQWLDPARVWVTRNRTDQHPRLRPHPPSR